MTNHANPLPLGPGRRNEVRIDPDREFHTRLQYDFYPGGFIKDFDNRFEENEDAIKGAVTSLVWLPKANTLFARAAIGPVMLHQHLGILAEKDITKVELPDGLSHDHVGVFTSFALHENAGESISGIERVRIGASEADRQATMALVNALGRRLMSATIDAAEKYVAGEFNPSFPAARVDSRGPIDLPEDSIQNKTFYGRALK